MCVSPVGSVQGEADTESVRVGEGTRSCTYSKCRWSASGFGGGRA